MTLRPYPPPPDYLHSDDRPGLHLYVPLNCASIVALKRDLDRFVGERIVTGCNVPEPYRVQTLDPAALDDYGGDCGVLQGVTIHPVEMDAVGRAVRMPFVEADWGMAWVVYPNAAYVIYVPGWSMAEHPEPDGVARCRCTDWPGFEYRTAAHYDRVLHTVVAWEECPNCARRFPLYGWSSDPESMSVRR